MKTKSISVLIVGIALIFIQSCKKDENLLSEKLGEVTFGYSNLAEKASKTGLKSALDLEDASAIIVTIEDITGNMVHNQKQLPLVIMGGSHITQPLSLPLGDYSITEFIVVDDQGVALYIAPLNGSAKAYLVSNPLPLGFTISKDIVTKIVPEVLSVEDAEPEDFGYSTFSFEVVETFNFLIAVFIYNESIENYELTTANLLIEADGSVVYSREVEAITDTVTINDGYLQYIVNVTKEGYVGFSDTLNNSQLKLFYHSDDNGPLVVVLDESLTSNAQPCPGMPTVTDADGNIYTTVLIGEQCWMAENLKTGVNIHSSIFQSDNGTIEKYCYNNDVALCDSLGGLYNWYEMMNYSPADSVYTENYTSEYFVKNTQGICPSGWHIPTYYEWYTLHHNDNSGLLFNLQFGGAATIIDNTMEFNQGGELGYYQTSEHTLVNAKGGIIGDWDSEPKDVIIYTTRQPNNFDLTHDAFSIRCIRNDN